MNEVWVIAQRHQETYGHGSFGESWKLPTTGPYDTGEPHPAFGSKHAAEEYIAGLPHAYRLQPLRLELKA